MKSLTKKSTYNLVVQSEDRSGSVIEAAIYGLFILSTIFGMWQFAAQTINSPRAAQVQTSPIVEKA